MGHPCRKKADRNPSEPLGIIAVGWEPGSSDPELEELALRIADHRSCPLRRLRPGVQLGRGVPELFEPLLEWVNGSLQLRYVTFVNASMAFFGWAFLRTKTLPRWIGWGTLIWSLGWLIMTLLTTLPATFVIVPLVFGVALVVHRPGPQRP